MVQRIKSFITVAGKVTYKSNITAKIPDKNVKKNSKYYQK